MSEIMVWRIQLSKVTLSEVTVFQDSLTGAPETENSWDTNSDLGDQKVRRDNFLFCESPLGPPDSGRKAKTVISFSLLVLVVLCLFLLNINILFSHQTGLHS